MDVQEVHEHIEHAHHAKGHSLSGKSVALIIAILAALMAFTELGEHNASSQSSELSVEAADSWAFYQAKTVRGNLTSTTMELLSDLADPGMSAERKAALDAHIASLEALNKRLDSDPQSGEGRKELAEKARQMEENRDRYDNSANAFGYATAALQLAVVLASASLLTGTTFLALIAIGLGGLAGVLDLVGWFAPQLMAHLV